MDAVETLKQQAKQMIDSHDWSGANAMIIALSTLTEGAPAEAPRMVEQVQPPQPDIPEPEAPQGTSEDDMRVAMMNQKEDNLLSH